MDIATRRSIGNIKVVNGLTAILELHKSYIGSIASQGDGVSNIGQIGELLAIDAGFQILVLRIKSICYSEPVGLVNPREKIDNLDGVPTRQLHGDIIGSIKRNENSKFVYKESDTIVPPLGAKVYPLNKYERVAISKN